MLTCQWTLDESSLRWMTVGDVQIATLRVQSIRPLVIARDQLRCGWTRVKTYPLYTCSCSPFSPIDVAKTSTHLLFCLCTVTSSQHKAITVLSYAFKATAFAVFITRSIHNVLLILEYRVKFCVYSQYKFRHSRHTTILQLSGLYILLLRWPPLPVNIIIISPVPVVKRFFQSHTGNLHG